VWETVRKKPSKLRGYDKKSGPQVSWEEQQGKEILCKNIMAIRQKKRSENGIVGKGYVR